MAKIKLILLLLVCLVSAGAGVILALRNTESVQLDLVFTTLTPLPVSILLLCSFILGIVAGILLTGITRVSRRLARRRPAPSQTAQDVVTAK